MPLTEEWQQEDLGFLPAKQRITESLPSQFSMDVTSTAWHHNGLRACQLSLVTAGLVCVPCEFGNNSFKGVSSFQHGSLQGSCGPGSMTAAELDRDSQIWGVAGEAAGPFCHPEVNITGLKVLHNPMWPHLDLLAHRLICKVNVNTWSLWKAGWDRGVCPGFVFPVLTFDES